MNEVDDVDVAEAAENFLGEFLDLLGTPYSLEQRRLDADTVEIAVTGEDLGVLIGDRGTTLAALQELTRTVVQRQAPGHRGRIVVDVSGYREARRKALAEFTRGVAAQVVESGSSRVFEPMPPADRKVVHDTANDIEGVTTTSEGEEPRRRVVILPVLSADGDPDDSDPDDSDPDDSDPDDSDMDEDDLEEGVSDAGDVGEDAGGGDSGD